MMVFLCQEKGGEVALLGRMYLPGKKQTIESLVKSSCVAALVFVIDTSFLLDTINI